MGFWSWLQGKMLGGKTVEISAKTIEEYIDQDTSPNITMRLTNREFIIGAACIIFDGLTKKMFFFSINLIANCVSKCEFKTFQKGKENAGEEHYTWNYEPNRNQNFVLIHSISQKFRIACAQVRQQLPDVPVIQPEIQNLRHGKCPPERQPFPVYI